MDSDNVQNGVRELEGRQYVELTPEQVEKFGIGKGTTHTHTEITRCFLDGQWWASTCSRLFMPVSRKPNLADAPAIAQYGHAENDVNGSGLIRMGYSREWLEKQGAEFDVIYEITDYSLLEEEKAQTASS
jgi:hypothetical protein